MEKSGCSSRSTNKPVRVHAASRRFWSSQEEEALVNALKSLRADGWKCDGSFKGGYMVCLEQMLAEKYPDSGLNVKHIKSKLQVWKRTYGHVMGILGSSGGAGATMDPSTSMIIAESEAVWDEYTKVHPEASSLRGKPLPWFSSWVEIFGNDRAHGKGAIDVGDAINELLHNAKSNDFDKCGENIFERAGDNAANDDPADDAISNTPPTTTPQAKSSTSTKRKRHDSVISDLEIVMGKWMDSTSKSLEDLATTIKQTSVQPTIIADSDSSDRKAVYKALSELADLNMQERIVATHRLVHNKADLDVFFGMDIEARSGFVRLLLSGHLSQ